MDSYVFHKVSFIYRFGSASANIVSFIYIYIYIYISFWFCVGKHFGCAQLQENVKHSQFMTQGVDRDIARR